MGKTTLVQQVASGLGQPVRYASADEPTRAIVILDEIQKLPNWWEAVKRLRVK